MKPQRAESRLTVSFVCVWFFFKEGLREMTVYHECNRICASSYLPATGENCPFANLRSGNTDSGLVSMFCEACEVEELSIY